MQKRSAVIFAFILCAGSAYADPIEWKVGDGGNGHFYERVDLNGVTSLQARGLAAALTHNGLTGHLATINLQAETDFLAANIEVTGLGQPTEFWLGGFQNTSSPAFAEPDGGWEWITDEPFAYMNWGSMPQQPNNCVQPPNNCPPPEDFLSTRFNEKWAWNDLPNEGNVIGGGPGAGDNIVAGYIVEYESEPVDLDIKPGSDPNSINLGSHGLLPVAILTTTNAFDATDIDVDTILFGDPVLLNDGGMGVSPFLHALEDVNDDGYIDLSLKFKMNDLIAYGALGDMSMEAILTGELLDGTPFRGSDSVRLVPPGNANSDLVVDAADYTIWANNFGSASLDLTDGNFNGVDFVDAADWTIWANHFGTDLSAPQSAAAAIPDAVVPEPSTFALAAIGLIGLLAYGCRRRRRA